MSTEQQLFFSLFSWAHASNASPEILRLLTPSVWPSLRPRTFCTGVELDMCAHVPGRIDRRCISQLTPQSRDHHLFLRAAGSLRERTSERKPASAQRDKLLVVSQRRQKSASVARRVPQISLRDICCQSAAAPHPGWHVAKLTAVRTLRRESVPVIALAVDEEE